MKKELIIKCQNLPDKTTNYEIKRTGLSIIEAVGMLEIIKQKILNGTKEVCFAGGKGLD